MPLGPQAGESRFHLLARLTMLLSHDTPLSERSGKETFEAEILAAIDAQRAPELPADSAFDGDLQGLAGRHACPGWGAHAQTLAFLSALIRAIRPQQVLEFGSGLSTLVMAMTLNKLQSGYLLSIDESQRFAARTRGWLEEEGLAARAGVKHCPVGLQHLQGSDLHCYELGSAVDEVDELDLLFVDGPNSMPVIGHPGARFGTLPLIRERLAPGAWILLDDARRRSERRVAARWAAMEGIEAIGMLPTGRGLMLLRNR